MEETKKEERWQWMFFDCPFCRKRMFSTTQRATHSERTGQQYIVTQYVCPHCDYWQKTKVPRKLAATVVDEHCLPVETTPTS